jgi:glucose-1-phosphate cytidylyltransferase
VQVVILAGGLGTRLSEETHLKPKPMIEIGGRPILWHIMKIFHSQGFRDFIVCCGYRGYLIKEYFANYRLHNSDLTIRTGTGLIDYHDSAVEDWNVTIVDTGLSTMTGGRLLRIKDYVKSDQFLMTYGDGLSDLSLKDLVETHRQANRIATVTAVQLAARFGMLDIEGQRVCSFREKPKTETGWLSGGFFVFQKQIFDFLKDDSTVLEDSTLRELASQGQLTAFRHKKFWACMDTQRDKTFLEDLWQTGRAPWKSW